MSIEWVSLDSPLISLPGHHVDGVVEYTFDQEITEVGHEDSRMGKALERHWKSADMVQVAMGDRDGLQVQMGCRFKQRQAIGGLASRVGTGIQEEASSFDFDEPGAGTDVRVGI